MGVCFLQKYAFIIHEGGIIAVIASACPFWSAVCLQEDVRAMDWEEALAIREGFAFTSFSTGCGENHKNG